MQASLFCNLFSVSLGNSVLKISSANMTPLVKIGAIHRFDNNGTADFNVTINNHADGREGRAAQRFIALTQKTESVNVAPLPAWRVRSVHAALQA